MQVLNKQNNNLGIEQQKFQQPTLKKYKIENHPLRPIVDRIGEVIGFTEKYGYGFWLRKVSRTRLSKDQILNEVEKANKLPAKYNKGGYLNNHI